MANVRRFLSAAGAAAVASLAMSSAVLATGLDWLNQFSATPTEAPKFGYTLTITGTSDYIFRGVSYTDNQPAFQPYLELTYGIAYLGFWGSNINLGCPAEICYKPWEFDIYAGIRPVTGSGARAINWDIGILYYTYPDAPGGGQLDYVEGKIAATTTPVTNLTLGFNAYATPDQGLAITETETIEGTAAYTLPKFKIAGNDWTPTLGGLIGFTHGDSNADLPNGPFLSGHDYTYWNAGLKVAVDKYFMDFRYWDTNIDEANDPNDIAAARFVFSAGVTLP